jgi:NADH-quinone oxidoreductase subunit I
VKQILSESWNAGASLVKGLWVTLRQLFAQPFTVQYPEERLTWPARSRGRLVLPRDPATGKDRCTACLLCQRICPNGSIEITVATHETGKRYAGDFLHHLDRCTFCGLCTEVCPFDALRMSHEHELGVRDKALLKRRLQTETLVFGEAWDGGLPQPVAGKGKEA